MTADKTIETVAGQNDVLTPGARRILDVASELFYWRGIHAVGVDTIAAESGITKRTLYNRFGSKDELIKLYLEARDVRWRKLVMSALDDIDRGSPRRRVLAPFDALVEWIDWSARGCCLVNAYAELPEPGHPGHQLAVEEKKWLRALFRQLLVEARADNPDALAVQLLSLHEGAMVCHSVADVADAAQLARSAAETLVAPLRQEGHTAA
ncbi:MAG: TetR/AcrR family transcriptional regulator [Streptomyces sp.]|uniref:TetR/AcrR family transcriptional regulator n=1 Tax=Streptomyces sp. TaxID=1931 RepID=UPI003D6AC7E8